MSIDTPGPVGSQAIGVTSQDLATMGVRELIGLLARLEEVTRGWPGAAWTGRWTVGDGEVDQIVSLQRQVIVELRHRRRRR